MSRIGKKLIILPEKVEVKINGQMVSVKGAKGSLDLTLPAGIKVSQEAGNLQLVLESQAKGADALWGLTRALLQNAVTGVSQGFSKTLEINGVGFKAAMQGKKLILNVGFSHPVEYDPAPGINIQVEKNQITISGIDRQLVGQTAAEIRDIKKPEPYKGKGIKYTDEIIRRKAGKVVKSA